MSSSSHPCPTPLMLFHGLMSSPQEFGLIAHALRSKGLRHEAPSVPGYTHAPQQMAPNWRGWRTGAREQLEERALGDGRVVIGGLCMGGILAAAAALEAPERGAGLVLLSPSFEFDGWGLTWLRHLRHLAYWTGTDRFFAMKERAPYGVKNEKIRRWIKNELEQRAHSAAGPARAAAGAAPGRADARRGQGALARIALPDPRDPRARGRSEQPGRRPAFLRQLAASRQGTRRARKQLSYGHHR
jgi:pimeloyl-ACP methyl ester carboxylesterase